MLDKLIGTFTQAMGLTSGNKAADNKVLNKQLEETAKEPKNTQNNLPTQVERSEIKDLSEPNFKDLGLNAEEVKSANKIFDMVSKLLMEKLPQIISSELKEQREQSQNPMNELAPLLGILNNVAVKPAAEGENPLDRLANMAKQVTNGTEESKAETASTNDTDSVGSSITNNQQKSDDVAKQLLSEIQKNPELLKTLEAISGGIKDINKQEALVA